MAKMTPHNATMQSSSTHPTNAQSDPVSSGNGFLFNALTVPTHTDNPPEHTDCVVIGAGIIGLMTAWALMKSGVRVVVVEKGVVAGEQSSRNWGWIRQQGRDFAELPIMADAGLRWKQIADELQNPFSLKAPGTLYVAKSDDDMARYDAWMKNAGSYCDAGLLTAEQVCRLTKSENGGSGGLHTPSDMGAEPWFAGPAIANALSSSPLVSIHEHCAARTLEMHAGRVNEVVTEKGAIRCEAVVIAGGSWSSLFLKRHGLSIPQLSVRASVAATQALPDGISVNADFGDVSVRRRADGGLSIASPAYHELFLGPDAFRAFGDYRTLRHEYMSDTHFRLFAPTGFPDGWRTQRKWDGDSVTPFEKMRVLDPAPNARVIEKARQALVSRAPSLGSITITHSWAGMIDTLPDLVPIMDVAPSYPGAYIATGMCGHGFGISPGIGAIMADFVQGNSQRFDLKPFRISRFSDGSPIARSSAL